MKLIPDFSNISHFIHSGFDDEALTSLCALNSKSNNLLTSFLDNYIFFPALFWPCKVYGFSKAFHSLLEWPLFLPLPFHSDHGTCRADNLYDIDKEFPTKYHICFSSKRYEFLKSINYGKIPIRTQHPYIQYRKKKNYCLTYNNRPPRCLFFIPHSLPGIDITHIIDSISISINDIFSNLGHDTRISFCVHYHDINSRMFLMLRQFGNPIFTCGHPSNPLFVDRFYNLISNFNFASSNSAGSQSFLCAELGITYFLCGSKPTFINNSNMALPLGELNLEEHNDEFDNFERNIFCYPQNSYIVKKYLDDVLGLVLNPKDIKKYKLTFFFELLRLLPFTFFKLPKSFFRSLLKNPVVSAKMGQLPS